jgi:hypothetical protein
VGSTYIAFRGAGFEAGDAAVEVWLILLVRAIDDLDDPPAWLREARDEWELQATVGFGHGVMPELDRFVTDDERRDAVLTLSRKASERLDSYGDPISRNDLNALGTGGPRATFTRDVDAVLFRRTARYFMKLFDGTLTPEENDARFAPRAAGQARLDDRG